MKLFKMKESEDMLLYQVQRDEKRHKKRKKDNKNDDQ